MVFFLLTLPVNAFIFTIWPKTAFWYTHTFKFWKNSYVVENKVCLLSSKNNKDLIPLAGACDN